MTVTTTDAGSVTPAADGSAQDPNGSLTVTRAELQKMIHGTAKAMVENAFKAVPSLDQIAALMDAKLESVRSAQPTDPTRPAPAAGNQADGGKVTMESLQERLAKQQSEYEKQQNDMKAIRAQLESTEKRRAEAEAKARDTAARAKVREQLSQHVSPALLDVVMDSFYDHRKRFQAGDDGTVTVRFKRDGYDEDLPLDKGIDEMLKSELKSYRQSDNARLPPARIHARLHPYQAQANSDNQPPVTNPALLEVARAIQSRNPAGAAALESAATAPVPGQKK